MALYNSTNMASSVVPRMVKPLGFRPQVSLTTGEIGLAIATCVSIVGVLVAIFCCRWITIRVLRKEQEAVAKDNQYYAYLVRSHSIRVWPRPFESTTERPRSETEMREHRANGDWGTGTFGNINRTSRQDVFTPPGCFNPPVIIGREADRLAALSDPQPTRKKRNRLLHMKSMSAFGPKKNNQYADTHNMADMV